MIFYADNTIHCTGPHGEPPIIAITSGEHGYNPIYTPLTAAALNERTGATPDVVESALEASMFGWHTPAAKLALAFVRRAAAIAAAEAEYKATQAAAIRPAQVSV